MQHPYDLTRLSTRQHFEKFLGIGNETLDCVLAFEPPREAQVESASPIVAAIEVPAFRIHRIPKKNRSRGYRIAWEPTYLKPAYKKLGRVLSKFFEHKLTGFPHPATFGYVGGRGTRDNALVHCGHARLLTVDIESFFPSITADRVRTLLICCGLRPEIAELVAGFVTIDGRLPLGLASSPVLSNAIFLPADEDLLALSHRLGASYSRYSDDMCFSGTAELPDVGEIEAVLGRHGFALARSKTRRSVRGQAHYVTGLSVADASRPHAPRPMKRLLRQELHYARKFGLQDHLLRLGVNDANALQEHLNRLDGTVKYVAFHEPRWASRIKPQWEAILQDAGKRASFAPLRQGGRPFSICVDEAEFQSPDGPMLALGIAVTQHADVLGGVIEDVLRDALGDPYAAGDIAAIQAKGLHFADATEDIRLDFVSRISSLPFEGYVVMGRLERPGDYQSTYLRLLDTVIKRRLMGAESRHATVVLEKNNKVGQNAIRALVAAAQAGLEAENNRRPATVTVDFVSKPSTHISVPDFLLGVLGRYLNSQDSPAESPEPRERLMFERIRDKYRLILNADDGTEYSRRRPIAPWHHLR